MKSLAEEFWFKTLDGFFYKQTLHLAFGKNHITRSYWNTRTRATIWFEDPPAPNPRDTLDAAINQLLTEGWETDIGAADEATPTLDFERWPEDLRFGTPLINPDPFLLGRGPFRYWEAVSGNAVVVMIGNTRVLVRDTNNKPTTVHRAVLEELVQVYPQQTVIRGVYDGYRIHVWDIPVCEGVDRIAFSRFEKRRPKYNGDRVWTHREISSGYGLDAYWITDESVEPEASAYSWWPRIMKGTYFVRPRLAGPPSRIAPRQKSPDWGPPLGI